MWFFYVVLHDFIHEFFFRIFSSTIGYLIFVSIIFQKYHIHRIDFNKISLKMLIYVTFEQTMVYYGRT